MKKNLAALCLFVILPLGLMFLYGRVFEYSGGAFERYQNPAKFALLSLAILGDIYIIVITKGISKNGLRYFWYIFGAVILLLLLFILLMGAYITKISIG